MKYLGKIRRLTQEKKKRCEIQKSSEGNPREVASSRLINLT
jgi:hypothetical protein